MLTKNDIIKGLKHHNIWRRGAEIEMLNPKYLGELIEGAIKILEGKEDKEKWKKK